MSEWFPTAGTTSPVHPEQTPGRSGSAAARANVAETGSIRRLLTVTILAAGLALGPACNNQKTEPAPANVGAAGGNNLFQDGTKARPAGPPPEEDGGNPAAQAGAASANPFEQKSPECKALEEEQSRMRAEVNRLMEEVVGPASSKAEEAYDLFQECQEDAGCLSDVTRYQARQSAYATARRVAETSEGDVEKLETQLHALSQKYASQCDNDPL